MNRISRILHLARFLTATAITLLGLMASAPAAFALRGRAPGGIPAGALTGPYPYPTVTHTVVASGMPGWQIAVIVAAAALISATIAVVAVRARAAHRTRLAPAT